MADGSPRGPSELNMSIPFSLESLLICVLVYCQYCITILYRVLICLIKGRVMTKSIVTLIASVRFGFYIDFL